jgi:hypothetical protein
VSKSHKAKATGQLGGAVQHHHLRVQRRACAMLAPQAPTHPVQSPADLRSRPAQCASARPSQQAELVLASDGVLKQGRRTPPSPHPPPARTLRKMCAVSLRDSGASEASGWPGAQEGEAPCRSARFDLRRPLAAIPPLTIGGAPA